MTMGTGLYIKDKKMKHNIKHKIKPRCSTCMQNTCYISQSEIVILPLQYTNIIISVYSNNHSGKKISSLLEVHLVQKTENVFFCFAQY